MCSYHLSWEIRFYNNYSCVHGEIILFFFSCVRARVDVGRDFVAAVAPPCTKYSHEEILRIVFVIQTRKKSCARYTRTIKVTSLCATDITRWVLIRPLGSGVKWYRETETSPSRCVWRLHDTTAYCILLYFICIKCVSARRYAAPWDNYFNETQSSRIRRNNNNVLPVSRLLLSILFLYFHFFNRGAHIL